MSIKCFALKSQPREMLFHSVGTRLDGFCSIPEATQAMRHTLNTEHELPASILAKHSSEQMSSIVDGIIHHRRQWTSLLIITFPFQVANNKQSFTNWNLQCAYVSLWVLLGNIIHTYCPFYRSGNRRSCRTQLPYCVRCRGAVRQYLCSLSSLTLFKYTRPETVLTDGSLYVG